MWNNVENKSNKSDGVGGHGGREVLEMEISQRTHHIFIHNRIGLRIVFVCFDSLLSFRSNVVFEKSTTGHFFAVCLFIY